MNLPRWSALAELLSSFAILVTLVYLTVEIQQNTQAIESTSRQAILDTAVSILAFPIGNPALELNMVKPNLTPEESLQLSAYLFTHFVRTRTMWQQYQAGALDEEAWLAVEATFVDTISHTQSRKWWDAFHRNAGGEFVDHLNPLLDKQPIRTTVDDVEVFR